MTRPVRSGFVVALLLMVGLVGLGAALSWYSRRLDRLEDGPLRPVSARASATQRPKPRPRSRPTPSGLRAPSADQIAALGSENAFRQRTAALALATRLMTPELEQAIRSAAPAGEPAAEAVLCLKGRLPDLVPLDSLIAHLPPEDDAIWPADVDKTVCFVSAISARVREEPDRVVRALLPFALAMPGRLRAPALAALENARLPDIPPDVRQRLHQGWHEGLSMQAAIALHADEVAPDLLEDWLRSSEPRTRRHTLQALGRVPRPSAVRLLVRMAAADPADTGVVGTLQDRHRKHHDVGANLSTLALNANEPGSVRQRALELLSLFGGAEQVQALEPLRNDPDPQIRAYAEATVAVLARR